MKSGSAKNIKSHAREALNQNQTRTCYSRNGRNCPDIHFPWKKNVMGQSKHAGTLMANLRESIHHRRNKLDVSLTGRKVAILSNWYNKGEMA